MILMFFYLLIPQRKNKYQSPKDWIVTHVLSHLIWFFGAAAHGWPLSLGIEPVPHWWEASALNTAPSLNPKERERERESLLYKLPFVGFLIVYQWDSSTLS